MITQNKQKALTLLHSSVSFFLSFFFLRKRELLKQVRDSFQLQKNKRADLNIQVLKGVKKVKLPLIFSSKKSCPVQ